MKTVLAGLGLALAALPAMSAQTAKPFTVQELVRLERISDPRLSPDGSRLAYTLRSTDYEANKGVKQIWALDLPAGTPRALTSGSGNSESPRWSADGQHLYFLSTRSGSAQVWRLALAGGEAQPVTQLPLDVGSFALSPTGDRLAVSMEVFPDCESLDCSRKKLDELGARKNSGTVHERLFMRHWDTWKNGTRSQLFSLALDREGKAGTAVLLSKGIDGDVPSKPFGDDSEFTFSPDGKTVVFAARIAGKTEAWSTNLDLWQVPADGSGKPLNLTAPNAAVDTQPLFSPDGRTLAWRAMKRPGFEADRYAIQLRDLATGATRELAADWDRSASSIAWAADGKTIYADADDLGQHRLFAIDVASGSVRGLTGPGMVNGYSIAGSRIVYAHNRIDAPDDLYLTDATGAAPKRLTQHNAERLEDVRFGAYEQFQFAGAGGDTVYGYVVKPWNYVKGRKYPVAFIIHGGPQGSMGNDWHYRWNPQTYAGQGYAVVFIDFHGSTGYGQKFTDSISGDWGGKPLEDLQKGWAHALKTYDFLDGTRAAALGASYGGYMINWIAGNWPDAFKALVNHDGIFDNRSMAYTTEELWFDEWEHGGTYYDVPQNYEKHNPVNHVLKWKTPMLVIHGEKDYRVPPEQGIATFTALQRRGIPSQFLLFPDENHWVLKPQNSVQWHETVQAWLQRWLKN
ncbi:MAG TPA: S9 family peptidase [Solimonas sp.]|nr:S9 family peptidase [Solimonas sp.]